MRFSIVINTYNRAHTLPATLDSLRWLRHPSFEVIVVNGPSTDGTEALLARHAGRIRIGRWGEANLSRSRNVGIAMARGEVVCFIDDDAIPEPDWLNELDTAYADPRVGAAGGYIRDHTGYSFQSRHVVCDRLGNGASFDDAAQAATTPGPGQFRFDSLTGTNCSFRREALLQIGGFDEEFAYFLDETDVVARIHDAGWRVVYLPNAEIHHKYAASHLRDTRRVPSTVYPSVRSKAYFCMRHGGRHLPLDQVMAHLEDYRRGLQRDYRWYLEHEQIDQTHHARLLDDIERGLRDGVRDAFAHPQGRLPAPSVLRGDAQTFLPFATLRPAARRLRICLLSQDYPPAVCGGIGIWTHQLATGLAAEGHEVSVVTRGRDRPTVDFQDGVWVHRIVPQWQPQRSTPALPDIPQVIKDYAYTAFDEVTRIRLRRGLDIVSAPIWDLEGIALVADGSLPAVVSLHSTFKLVLPTKHEWLNNPEYRAGHVDKIIHGESWLFGHARHILGNSQAIVRDIEAGYGLRLPRERLAVVPHGVADVSELNPDPAPAFNASARQRLLFVGRFEKRKGVDLLLQVLPDLLQAHEGLEVVLAGDHALPHEGGASLAERFTQAHRGQPWLARVRLSGHVSEATLHALYRDCDVFVAPSRYESFGLIFLEAMRHGKACVGTRIGGIEEVVTDGQTGLLVPSDDSAALAAAIDRLLRDTPLRQRLGEAARADFERRFSRQAMVRAVARTLAGWAGRPDLIEQERNA